MIALTAAHEEERRARENLRDALRSTVPDPGRAAAVMAAADSWRRASLRAAEQRREEERCPQ